MRLKISWLAAFLIAGSMAGCGTGPASPGAEGRQANPTQVTLWVQFPPRTVSGTANGISALVSASTTQVDFSVFTTINGQRLGGILMVAPPGGGPVSGAVTIPASTGAVVAEVRGLNGASGTPTALQYFDVNIVPGANVTLNVPLVEYFQGSICSPTVFLSPDSRSFLIDQVILDQIRGSYELVVHATLAAAAGDHHSSANLDQFSVNALPYIRNGLVELPVDIPDVSNAIWNRYDLVLNFFPGGIPSANPTITARFSGTFTHDVGGAVINASGTAPGPVGQTMTLTTGPWQQLTPSGTILF